MREPLVDTVDKRQICTDHCAIEGTAFWEFISVQKKRRHVASSLDIRFENDDGERHQRRC